LTVAQAATELGLRPEVVTALVRHQRIYGAYTPDAGPWLLPRDAVESYRAERAAEGDPPPG
jgi:hypothetical protein